MRILNKQNCTPSANFPDRIPVALYREMLASGTLTVAGTNGHKRASPEEDLHRSCFELVELLTAREPILQYLVHVPNGGARSKGEAGKLKAMGTKPGIPDFVLPRTRGKWRGLALELKAEKGRLSEDQKFWLRGLEDEGYLVSVCRTLEAFQEILQAFLNGQALPDCVEQGWNKAQNT